MLNERRIRTPLISSGNGPVHFGTFEFDLEARRLTRLGVVRRLENLSAIALVYLIEHRGQIVTSSELIQALWPQQAHRDFDHRLDKVIAKSGFAGR